MERINTKPLQIRDVAWLMSRITKQPNGCWIWNRALTSKGYGHFSFPRNSPKYGDTSHRLSWTLFRGPIPNGQQVLHNCPDGDNPACCNPEHLWIGTGSDNSRDASRKGKHNKAKITFDIARKIFQEVKGGKSIRLAAEHYGLKYNAVWRIVSGKGWQ